MFAVTPGASKCELWSWYQTTATLPTLKQLKLFTSQMQTTQSVIAFLKIRVKFKLCPIFTMKNEITMTNEMAASHTCLCFNQNQGPSLCAIVVLCAPIDTTTFCLQMLPCANSFPEGLSKSCSIRPEGSPIHLALEILFLPHCFFPWHSRQIDV